MKRFHTLIVLATLALLASFAAITNTAMADATRVSYLKPQYLPPADLARVLGARDTGGHMTVEWRGTDGMHSVEIRRNDAANLVIIAGSADDVAAIEAMVKAVDVPPRQISIEARIVEIDENKARRLGIDWSNVWLNGDANTTARRQTQDSRNQRTPGNYDSHARDEQTSTQSAVSAYARFSSDLKLLEENGAATYRDTPRILTLNNRAATILDGQRVTYVTRYSSYANMFSTDSMDAGLRLNVLPSLGESGYLTLDIRAELTSLSGNISGSPVKDGQIVENTVVVKDGDTVLLGGFTRTIEEKHRSGIPGLGRVLPFLFSRETKTSSRRQSFVVITPHVVDLAGGLDGATRGAVEGR